MKYIMSTYKIFYCSLICFIYSMKTSYSTNLTVVRRNKCMWRVSVKGDFTVFVAIGRSERRKKMVAFHSIQSNNIPVKYDGAPSIYVDGREFPTLQAWFPRDSDVLVNVLLNKGLEPGDLIDEVQIASDDHPPRLLLFLFFLDGHHHCNLEYPFGFFTGDLDSKMFLT